MGSKIGLGRVNIAYKGSVFAPLLQTDRRRRRDYFASDVGRFKIFAYICALNNCDDLMKIKEEYKVREMAGEHIVVMQGRYGVDMTRVIALNDTSLWLWSELQGREFELADVRDLLLSAYDVDAQSAERDAQAWVARLEECNLLV